MARTVTKVELPGSNSPTFIIRDGEAYYVTQSVAKYDPALVKTPEQKSDVASVRELYETALKAGGGREAVKLPPENNVMSFQHFFQD